MNHSTIKTSKKTYVILAAGIVIGAIGAAAVLRGPIVPKAYAEPNQARMVGNLSSENMATLRNLNESFANLAEYIAPAVVAIRVEGGRSTDLMGRRMPVEMGEGSGVIIRPDGWILTNDHVVGGFEKVTVILNDGREFSGKVTRSDYSDLAVVKIEAANLPVVSFADSNQVRMGQYAIAVGSPFGLENSITIGHVSALGRDSQIGDPRYGTRAYPDLIQTDAAINRGNSGGPLLNIEGQVIGINTAIFSQTGGSMGIGFAIPANQARLTADMLIEKGRIVRGYLGMVPENLKSFRKKELGLEGGAVVREFAENAKSPARDAGLKVGDVITRIGSIAITGQHDVRNAMLVYGPGETVTIEYVRDKQKRTAQVKLLDATKEQVELLRNQDKREPRPTPEAPELDFPDIPELLMPDRDAKPRTDEPVPPVREGQAKLGVEIEPLTSANRSTHRIPTNVEGVLIRSVQSDSVAARLGLKPGDVLMRIGDVEIRNEADVRRAMTGVKWGDTKNVKYGRFGDRVTSINDVPVPFE